MRRSRCTLVGFVCAGLLFLYSTVEAVPISVTNNANDGDGSFRDAVEQATVDPLIDTIEFKKNLGTILIDSSIVYSGPQALFIDAGSATIEPSNDANFDLFVSNGGGDLEIQDLTVRNGGANGILVEVPTDATGEISVILYGVDALDNGGFGILIDDQEDPDDEDNENGSDAGIYLSMSFCSALSNGFDESDRDGTRAQDGGAGGIVAEIEHCAFDGNGGDGFEADERGDGGVTITATHSSFDGNGAKDVTDLDDGFDVDEVSDGNVSVYLYQSSVSGNFQEGLDFDEAGEGHLILVFEHVSVDENGLDVDPDAGADLSEEDDGDVWLVVLHSSFNSNGDRGLEISEDNDGDFEAELTAVIADGNDSDGINLEEDNDGDLTATLRGCKTRGNDDEGMQIEEGDEGDLDVAIVGTRAADNLDHGIQVEQDDDNGDEGVLFLQGVTFKGNGDDDLDTDGVEVIQSGP